MAGNIAKVRVFCICCFRLNKQRAPKSAASAYCSSPHLGSAEMHARSTENGADTEKKFVKIADKWLSTSIQAKIFRNIVCIFMR